MYEIVLKSLKIYVPKLCKYEVPLIHSCTLDLCTVNRKEAVSFANLLMARICRGVYDCRHETKLRIYRQCKAIFV